MGRPQILVVDDDDLVVALVSVNLKAAGYDIRTAADGKQAIEILNRTSPHLIILDLAMPILGGIPVLRRLRRSSQTPVIVLSARGEVTDRIKCLELGADDYLVKPFCPDELVARVKAVLRRDREPGQTQKSPSFAEGKLKVDFASKRVLVDRREVRLTPIEYQLLEQLVTNREKVLTYRDLLHRVWGPEYYHESAYLHVFIHHLRNKLKLRSRTRPHITTVPGIGYRFQ